jgi:hypothetical protein
MQHRAIYEIRLREYERKLDSIRWQSGNISRRKHAYNGKLVGEYGKRVIPREEWIWIESWREFWTTRRNLFNNINKLRQRLWVSKFNA